MKKITSLTRLHSILNRITFDITDITACQPLRHFFKFPCVCMGAISVCLLLSKHCLHYESYEILWIPK